LSPLLACVDGVGQTALLDEKLTDISQGRLRKPRFVCSAYLLEALRPYFADYDPTRYAELFDETEILFSLIVADQMTQHHMFTEPWLGLFVIDASETATLEDSRYGAVLAAIGEVGDQWSPLQAGMFGGSLQRVLTAAGRVTEDTRRLRYQVL
jgi:hypothetical protein